jgi:hypothetical protein
MATSLVSTGLQFPDSTIQTTAATAGGGMIEAVATGSLANGDRVVINTDGTVSVAATIPQSVGSPVVFESASTFSTNATFDSTNNKVVLAYSDGGNSGYGTVIVGEVSGASISFGTAVVFNSANTFEISITFDSANSKVVIAYQNFGNSNYGTAIVGTVSGTSISLGTAVVFESATTNTTSAIFTPTGNKIVIAYGDVGNSEYGTAIVGTVSGTNISFGTAVVFASSVSVDISATFDSTNNKVVIAYGNFSSSRWGTSIVGTVSGTSISFGTAVVFEFANSQNISTTYNSTSNKVVIAYTDVGNSSFGTAIIGTVSSTSISFGTAVVFENASTSNISATFDSANNKVVIAYGDGGNSNFGTAIVGTVSGTSISFGTAVVFESAATNGISTVFDSTAGKIAVAYTDGGNSNYGTAVVFQNESTNLTSENFIGISSAAYTNGQTAKIQVAGAVDDAQTGLTAGQAYYVTKAGALSLTPDSPSVFAGTAVSSTKLIIKG